MALSTLQKWRMRRHFEKRFSRKEMPEPKPQFHVGKMVCFWHLIPVCDKHGKVLGKSEQCGWGKIIGLDVIPVLNESLGLDFGDKKITGYWKKKIIGFRYPRVKIKVFELIPDVFSPKEPREPLVKYTRWFSDVGCMHEMPISEREKGVREDRERMLAGDPLYFKLPKASVLLARLDTNSHDRDKNISLKSLKRWREEPKSGTFVEVSGENVSEFCFESYASSGERVSNFRPGSFSRLFGRESATECPDFLVDKSHVLISSWADVSRIRFRERVARLAEMGLLRTKARIRRTREILLPEGSRRMRQRSK